jgi:hypothetical protein
LVIGFGLIKKWAALRGLSVGLKGGGGEFFLFIVAVLMQINIPLILETTSEITWGLKGRGLGV